jgi:hypothetical protein
MKKIILVVSLLSFSVSQSVNLEQVHTNIVDGCFYALSAYSGALVGFCSVAGMAHVAELVPSEPLCGLGLLANAYLVNEFTNAIFIGLLSTAERRKIGFKVKHGAIALGACFTCCAIAKES